MSYVLTNNKKKPMPGVGPTMKEFKAGTLHSGSATGPKVTSRKQAIAIGLNSGAKNATGKRMANMVKKKGR